MSSEDNKVDLSSVNKTPKQPLSAKLTGYFKNSKKVSEPGRDEIGRFAGSSKPKLWSKKGTTNLKKKHNFQWSRAIPIIAVVALVGGFLVWRSFAGTKLYANQYSVYKCAGFDNTKIKADDACINDSAEALTFRVYETMFNRAPQTTSTQKDKNGKPSVPEYQYWVQRLAGDRVQPTEMTKSFISRYAKQSNEQYIDALYQNLLNRKADAKGKAYWKNELDSKRWSREKTAAHFAATSEAKRVQQSAFATFLSKAPRVTIAENAKKTRDERLFTAAANTNKAKSDYNTISKFTADGRKNRDNAKSTASKSTPSRGDLTSIANNEKAVRDNLSKTSSVINKLKDYERQNKALYDRAKDVAAYSPDISADAIKKQYDSTVFYRAGAENISKELTTLIKEISGHYKTAEGKYEQQIKQTVQAPGGVTDGQPITTAAFDTTKCGVAVMDISPARGKSDKNCAAKFQNSSVGKLCGLAVDGDWGGNTQTCYDKAHGFDTKECGNYKTMSNGVCVDKYIGATAVGCAPGYKTHKVAFANKNKYSCIKGSNLALPRSLACAKSQYYKKTKVGTYYQACVRNGL